MLGGRSKVLIFGIIPIVRLLEDRLIAECGGKPGIKIYSTLNFTKPFRNLIVKFPTLSEEETSEEVINSSISINPNLNRKSLIIDSQMRTIHSLNLMLSHSETLNFDWMKLESVLLRKGGYHWSIPHINKSLYSSGDHIAYFSSQPVKKGLLIAGLP